MAWDPIGQSEDDYSGDAPMDAFGIAVSEIAALWSERLGRLPSTAELARCLRESLARAPAGAVLNPASADALLKRWLEAKLPDKPKKRRVKAKTGDLLRIPYASGGARAVYGRVLFAPDKDSPRGAGLGVCVVVLDRDVQPGDVLEQVPGSPWLLGPLHPSDRKIRDGTWEVLCNLPLRGRELLLPCFSYTEMDPASRQWVRRLRDYFGNPVEDTPENRARVISPSVGGDNAVVQAIRALRDLGRWDDSYEDMLPTEEPSP